MPVQLMGDSDTIEVRDNELPVPDGDEDTIYTLKPITRDVYRDVFNRHSKTVPNPRTGRTEKVTNWEKVGEDLLNYALIAWDGILFEGQPVPCELTYKLKLDPTRSAALLDRAGMSQVKAAPEVRQRTF